VGPGRGWRGCRLRPVDGSPYFALSLTNRFLPDLLQVPASSSGVNYGAESVEFGPPLSAGDRVRGAAALVGAAEVKGGVQTTVEIRVEVDGAAEPACVVRSLSRWLA
jgi:acyl dehydratase